MSAPKELSFIFVHRIYVRARKAVIARRGYRPYPDRLEAWSAASKWDREVGAEFVRLLNQAGIRIIESTEECHALATNDDE